MDAAVFLATLAAAVASGTAIMYACLGELIAERAGVLNLGVEGMMLTGALAGFATVQATGSAPLGALAALAAGAALSLVHALAVVGLRANQVVSGLALTMLGSGLTALLGAPLIGQPAVASFGHVAIPVLADLPVLGGVFFRQDMLTYGTYLLVPLLWLFLARTRAGFVLRACGEHPAAADSLGTSVAAVRVLATAAGGALAGLGGAAISLAASPGWNEGITAGRGWIAIALVIFATWHPARAALGATLFGGVTALQFALQSAGAQVSPFFLDMLPYLCTIGVLVLATSPRVRRLTAAPAALGRPYDRELRA